MNKIINCPICGSQINSSNGHHIKKCIETFVNQLSNEKIIEIKDLYLNQEYSMVDMSNYFGFGYSLTEKILRKLGLKRRSAKNAAKTSRCRNKYKKTCIDHFGVPHNFCKESTSRKEWEAKLLEKEGITNVFQRDSVKKKIIETSILHYGENFRKVINSKEHIINKWVESGMSLEEAAEKYNKYIQEKVSYILNGNFISNLSVEFEKLLKKFNVKYEMEFKIPNIKYNRYYDFKIDNYLIELNGDFWHAYPGKYCENDELHFPDRMVKAKDIWKKDEEKKKLALSKGYTFIILWEHDLKDPSKIQKIENILKLYAIRQNKINKESSD